MQRHKIAFSLLLAAMLLGCGGLDLQQASKSSFFDPEKWFPGKKSGYGVAYDRNGNVVQNFFIQRDCQAPLATSGTCSDLINYSNLPATRATMKYSLEYMDNLDVTIAMEHSADEITRGQVYGSNLILKGKKRIMGAPALSTVAVHFHRVMGPGEPAVQKENYTYAGLAAGSVEIFWQKSEF
jgi:hypothetical protein